ncbi:Bestrophin, RFP-TM, chloride channel-domain-containing protein [Diplogelasinospora grovesii]|uniref:Bestrophin, RFP-TM, chloride channel-domain-containing protein n=1 Tax=Diplogelasinospora grovesii TaxID=303347 RepID=A0AAN6N2Z7_9PEZI|nr:Bestrophin, RFP-TM, chloride channel-domain-containing protein [Diplogelasinospora grovesii]
MAEDGPTPISEPAEAPHQSQHSDPTQKPTDIRTNMRLDPDPLTSPTSPRVFTPNPFSRKNSTLDLDDYFTGPRDIQKHSKWPLFLQMHGSILPKMIVPLLAIAGWSGLITAISMKKTNLGISNILLTVLGFVVGLGLSFRSSTAYERYAEGRRYWAQLVLTSQNLGRVFWVHATEREGEQGQKDLLAKLTALNLIVAFAVALKHKLRFEPYTCYEDISNLVQHLDTFAQAATREEPEKAHRHQKKPGFFKSTGEYLGISFAASNPRKAIKKSGRPLGNLPLEILSYLASFTDELIRNGQLSIPMQQTLAYNNLAALNDVLTGTDRVLSTPLPIAYTIAIAQITWVYILLLPFQLLPQLEWITIPASVAAAYIILGILFIGREIENPFGQDVNDLPLEQFCAQVAADMDLIASKKKPENRDWIETLDNRVMWPLSHSGWNVWMHRGEAKIREAIRHKIEANFEQKKEEAAAYGGAEKAKGANNKVTVDSV